MRNSKIFEFIKKNKIYYIIAIIATAVDAYVELLIPAITGYVAEGVLSKHLGFTTEYEPPKYLERYVNYFGGDAEVIDKLWVFAILIVFIGALTAIIQFIKGKSTATASENLAYSLRNEIYEKLMKVKYSYYGTINSGDIIQRCTTDITLVRMFFGGQIIEVVRVVSITVFAFIMMLSINVQLTLYSTMLLPIIFISSIYIRKTLENRQKDIEEAESSLTGSIQETAHGIRVIKAFNNQNLEIERFNKLNRKTYTALRRILEGHAYFWSLSDFICLTQFLVVIVASSIAGYRGDISVGEYIIFTTYTLRLIWPIRFASRIFAEYSKTRVAIDRVNELLNLEEEEGLNTGETPEVNGNIEISNLNFAFEDDKHTHVLKNINLSIKKGESVGILGSTGSGKSTLMHLLMRLYDYEDGSIKINGTELKDINKEYLRSEISIVLQDNFLFAKSIFENIKLSNPKANEDDIKNVAQIASIHETIKGFEKGYETLVGEKGVTLSGGQKQRTTIARTLIRNSKILIFDDSLSAVDVETDQKIRSRLQKHKKDLTTIIIAQRINTLMECDKIVVMDKGEITNIGSHDELILQEGLYKKVWDIQNLDTDEDYIG